MYKISECLFCRKLSFLIIKFIILNLLLLNIPVAFAKNKKVKKGITPQESKLNNFILSGYTEIGERSLAEDYEEEDKDMDYTYQNYHIRLQDEVSDRLNYDVSSFIYNKDYKSADSLDNISAVFKTNWSYYLKKLKTESLELDFKLKYKEKRFKNSPANEYDEFRAIPTFTKKKDLYRFDLALGLNNFDYLTEDNKDEFKIFTKIGIERYFLEKRLLLISSYKIENTEQQKLDRKRTKQKIMGGFDYVFDFLWIYKIITMLEWGQRDTKEEEERDEDFDYEYWRYYIKTEHRINPKFKTALKYQYFKKDYLIATLDHRGFYIRNNWDYEILDDEKQRLNCDFGFEYKDIKYSIISDNDYKKQTFETKLNYKRKKNWQASIGLEQNFYNFDSKDSDKKRTYVRLSAEKLFLEEDLVLSLDLKYKYTNYKSKNENKQEAIRLTFKYKF